MDLSGDGLSLVASCPGGSNGEVALTGHVSGFAESGGIWSQVGDAIAGVDANDRFGRSVSIADNGSRLASSYIHDGSRDIFACSISQVAAGSMDLTLMVWKRNFQCYLDWRRKSCASDQLFTKGASVSLTRQSWSRRKLQQSNLLQHHLSPNCRLNIWPNCSSNSGATGAPSVKPAGLSRSNQQSNKLKLRPSDQLSRTNRQSKKFRDLL
jgi:hypothetical protein